MFGSYGGYGGYGNNPFAGGFSELASDWMINRFVPGGLHSKIKFEKRVFCIEIILRSNGNDG